MLKCAGKQMDIKTCNNSWMKAQTKALLLLKILTDIILQLIDAHEVHLLSVKRTGKAANLLADI